MTTEFEIIATTQMGVPVIVVVGDVDVYTAPKLKQAIMEKLQNCNFLAVDLSEVNHLDGVGTAVLIGGLKRCRDNGGDLLLVNPSNPVRRYLKVTGFGKIFTIVDTVDEAVKALNARTATA